MDIQLKEIYESRDALENLLDQARKVFIKDLEACKMGYDVVKVVNYVISYPNNTHITLKKDAQSNAAVSGSAFMQMYSEYQTIKKIIALNELEQKQQGDTNVNTETN